MGDAATATAPRTLKQNDAVMNMAAELTKK